mmetsp:Transcript_80901/g.187873  ORF Transcript_80901/g.187873 Transcript_80901/m.187873 type:complete len:155 (-) Transcript_80901:1623-2087(-)
MFSVNQNGTEVPYPARIQSVHLCTHRHTEPSMWALHKSVRDDGNQSLTLERAKHAEATCLHATVSHKAKAFIRAPRTTHAQQLRAHAASGVDSWSLADEFAGPVGSSSWCRLPPGTARTEWAVVAVSTWAVVVVVVVMVVVVIVAVSVAASVAV